MSQHKYDELQRALSKDQLAPVYYLYGPETILREEAAQAILDRALPPEERAFNFENRTLAGLESEELHSLLNALPMLGTRRVVFLHGTEVSRKKPTVRTVLLKYLGNPSPDTVLLLIEAGSDRERAEKTDTELVARSYAIDFQPLKDDSVPGWLEGQAQRLGIEFGKGAVEHLAEATGYDLGAMRSELAKFASFPREGPLTRDQVGDLIGVRHGETLEDWRDAVLDGRTAEAIHLLRPLLARTGVSGVRLVTLLGTTLVGVALARSRLDRQRGPGLERALFASIQRARLFGLGDWNKLAQRWARWAENWTGSQLRQAIRIAMTTDRALKDAKTSDEEGVMTDLVLQLHGCRSQRPASERKPGRTETAGV